MTPCSARASRKSAPMNRSLAAEVGFADNSVENYGRSGNRLEVCCRLWNHAVAVVVFEDALSLLDRG